MLKQKIIIKEFGKHLKLSQKSKVKSMSTIKVGDRVKLIALPPYVKTAEPMPMLHSPDVLEIGAEGVILDRRPGGYYGVRFTNGSFLLDEKYLEIVTS